MFRLSHKLKEESPGQRSTGGRGSLNATVRDRLLTKEFADIETYLNKTCRITFPCQDKLHEFELTIVPEEGMWRNGKFRFIIKVPEEYNIKPPTVKCLTQLWHPNISLDGSVCLSILRDHSLDGSGWAPTRSLKDVIWGLDSLFTDLCDFDDPLNTEAAEQYRKNPREFRRMVESYLYRNQQRT